MLCSQILWLGWVDPTKPPDIVNGFGSSSGQRRVSFRDKVLGRDCKVLSSQGVLAEGMVADEPKAMVARGYMNNGNGSTIQANTNGLGKTGSYAGVTTTTTKENNSTHDPGIAYPFGVECLDHATSKEGTINVVNSINRVLEIREDVVVPRLLSKRVVELAKTITKEEVVGIALRSMGSYKAPSKDGFHALFLKKYWDMVGDDVWRLVYSAFKNGSFNQDIVETLMVLILENERPTTFK
ncbi:hypothetical protein NC652_024804 [Populus alba x Populus x berolinensis]|nr:hypothetical protein NC652_024804 [Populus alba x Populus x berolinensis]